MVARHATILKRGFQLYCLLLSNLPAKEYHCRKIAEREH